MKHFSKQFLHFLSRSISIFCIVLIRVYRVTFSPSVGIFRFFPEYPRPSCVFYPTCSEYSILVFKKYSFFTALKKTIQRIRRCHPETAPQVDMP